ncbi:hypothetical protein V6N11_022123 [Hibiscus sabdariffa]|uniref:Uncharacterized protein n=1 Tax=Hibiscus sabdariffa TaxID=183260 RepID=A0ABR2TI77_9ROSI
MDAFNEVCFGGRENEVNRNIGEAELMGIWSGWAKVVEEVTGVREDLAHDPNWTKILEDLNFMGFNKGDLDPSYDVAVESVVQETNSAGIIGSWAREVDKLNNPSNKGSQVDTMDEAGVESIDFFF